MVVRPSTTHNLPPAGCRHARVNTPSCTVTVEAWVPVQGNKILKSKIGSLVKSNKAIRKKTHTLKCQFPKDYRKNSQLTEGRRLEPFLLKEFKS
ncbi:hypothetical protein E2C01_052063 [Portunus trituberculatus]|uniref:Uncharacterized protein n=1 Tax=Portunus trituberculatus TaxID=210409 RepID=A0A5B7GM24_PORTR|nr:hypothetical protein [Portunus trituberculatus]